jgi:glutamyl-tRNA reductase
MSSPRLAANPGAASAAAVDFHAIGLDHASSSARLRDLVFVETAALPTMLGWLREAGLGDSENGGAVLLSTCDRVEAIVRCASPEAARAALAAALARNGRVSAAEIEAELKTHSGAAAVRRLFAIASALESQMLGEPQVLGQVKDAHAAAAAAGTCAPALDALFAAAYGAAKRVRAETALAERPVTMAAAALRVARDIHGEIARTAALLLGDGEMGELLVRHFTAAGLRRIAVAAPLAARAEQLARVLDCHIEDFDKLEEALARADIVISACGTRRLIVTAELARAAHRRRRRRPMFLIDAAVPGDLDPAIDAIEGLFRYDLADLEAAALEGQQSRRDAADAAWRIVDEATAAFLRGRDERKAAAGIAALRARFEAERAKVLETVSGDGAAEATRLLVNRLLHGASVRLRELAADDPEAQEAAEALLADLFALARDREAPR